MKKLETEPWSSENFYLDVTSVIFITRQSSKYCRCQLAKSILSSLGPEAKQLLMFLALHMGS